MTGQRLQTLFYILAALIGAALLYIRATSIGFVLGTDTFSHPYKSFVALLILGGCLWMLFIPLITRLIQRIKRSTLSMVWSVLFLGVVFRVLFFGSTPIYEDDWNRYLWDGIVTVEGHNPYQHPPSLTWEVDENTPSDILALRQISDENDRIAARINNPDLTTIYPPVAVGLFSLATIIKPASLDALRGVYLGLDLVSFWLLVKTLTAYGRDRLWAAIYWLNPMLIYSVYNAGHMDIILVPCLLAALWAVKTRPLWAGLALGVAGAVKFWPLLLGPVLLRHYRHKPLIFISAGALAGLACLALTLPMLMSLGENSGLLAYSETWQRSSFLFDHWLSLWSLVVDDAGRAARLSLAVALTVLSFWLALQPEIKGNNLPGALLILPLALFLISPTGYPWYVLWFLVFLPFFPLYGAALLTVTVTLYYVRFAMGERDIYDLYLGYVIPLQFGLPLLVLGFEYIQSRRRTP